MSNGEKIIFTTKWYVAKTPSDGMLPSQQYCIFIYILYLVFILILVYSRECTQSASNLDITVAPISEEVPMRNDTTTSHSEQGMLRFF